MPDADRSAALPPDCWRQIFGNEQPVAIEVGPGRGEFLLASARREPRRNFFAIEHSASRTREITARLGQHEITNARVVCGDATCIVDLLPEGSVAAVHVFFPDPWWKRRHGKRRLWTPRFVAGIRRVLAAGATVELVTDVPDYFALAQSHLDADPGLERVSLGTIAEMPTSFARKAVVRGATLHRSVHRRV